MEGLTRRQLLQGAGMLIAASSLPGMKLAFADAPVEERFIFIILRGAMDGLAAMPPYGDKNYASARGGLALPASAYTPLDNLVAAHNSFSGFTKLFTDGEAAVVHAVSTPYRERSHFDAQNVLECGAAAPNGQRDGWINRALSLYGPRPNTLGLSIGQTIPLMMQGDVAVGTWAPAADGLPADTVLIALEKLYRKDALFHTALAQAVDVHNIADNAVEGDGFGGKMGGRRGLQNKDAMAKTVKAVAQILSDPAGPRIATIEVGGWDTHAQQGLEQGPLANLFTALDAGLATFKTAMGDKWQKTVIMVATEFGRTVAQNGTNGSDHGTASCALLVGGAVNGGKVHTRWPGLDKTQLHENRDLRPTTDMREVAKAVLIDHLKLAESDVAARVFPGSDRVRPLEGLIRA
ncbi:MAG TPA: DUF1501 domain-containing protein [Patescibacteria group bacterium]|nr:DUF1501 domain-containing protein [Patescibacteria group bacterium]